MVTDRQQSFWTTLPGILTGIAAVLTGVTGLVAILSQYGILGSGPESASAAPATVASVAEARDTAPAATPGQTTAAEPSPSPPSPAAAASRREPMVTIEARDGTRTEVFAESLQHRQTGRQLYLLSGQSIAFDRLKSIEITRVLSDQAQVRIVLDNDLVVEGGINAGLYPYGFSGQNDIGAFEIAVTNVARITFTR